MAATCSSASSGDFAGQPVALRSQPVSRRYIQGRLPFDRIMVVEIGQLPTEFEPRSFQKPVMARALPLVLNSSTMIAGVATGAPFRPSPDEVADTVGSCGTGSSIPPTPIGLESKRPWAHR